MSHWQAQEERASHGKNANWPRLRLRIACSLQVAAHTAGRFGMDAPNPACRVSDGGGDSLKPK